MQAVLRSRAWAFFCVAVLLLCIVCSWPVAETGMHDDGFYISMARVLAQTGHIHYNGWGAPTLGIQLFVGALFIKLFGFSFTVVRLTTILVALATAALFQRTLVRSGVTEFNAAVGAVTLMTSPVMLPVITSFITDLWCLFAIVLCLYCCLRSLQESEDRTAAFWIAAAAVGNALFGSTRQVAWLGVMVMVPATIYMQRHRRMPRNVGLVSTLASLLFVVGVLHWLAHQTYTLPESLAIDHVPDVLKRPSIFVRPALEIPMLCLPVLFALLPRLRNLSRRGQWLTATVAGLVLLAAWREHTRGLLWSWAVPFNTQYGSLFGPNGVYHLWPVWGVRPTVLPLWFRSFLAIATVSCTFAYIATISERKRIWGSSARSLVGVLAPFSLAYAALLLPRAAKDMTIDRYLLPLVAVAMIAFLLTFQSGIKRDLPKWSMALAGVVAVYSVLTLQDAFGMYRVVVRAGEELRAAGVPRTAFDGGWEYDGLSQLTVDGYVHQIGIRMPPGQQLLFGHRPVGPCELPVAPWIPDVRFEYALSYSATGCGGPTNFPAITYRRFLSPHEVTVYIVKDPDFSGEHTGDAAQFVAPCMLLRCDGRR